MLSFICCLIRQPHACFRNSENKENLYQNFTCQGICYANILGDSAGTVLYCIFICITYITSECGALYKMR